MPENFEQQPSSTWNTPEATKLGRFFSDQAPADKSLSGVFLLDKPRAAFLARLGLAALAEQTLDIQYYLWKGDATGSLLIHRALEAADRGVSVRILIDDIYHSGRDAVYAAIDAHPNIQVRVFNPIGNRKAGRNLNFVINKSKLNHRMHNKIFLADGAAAVLGGRNIGDDYFGSDPELNFRDLDALTVGPAAAEAGKSYDLYWNSRFAVPIRVLRKKPASIADLEIFRTDLDRHIDAQGAMPYTLPFGFDEIRGEMEALRRELIWATAEIIVDPLERFAGNGESAFVRLGRQVTDSVENEIVIQTAYLIPTRAAIDNMTSLTSKGVRIRVMTNSMMSNNHVSVHGHYMKYRKRLIEAGVELYELRADAAMLDFLKRGREAIANSHAGLHTKAVVVDDRLTLIGSFNMDPRSRDLNSEIGLLVHSEEFASQVLKMMEPDFDPANSYRVTLNESGRLRWTGSSPDGQVEFNNEPGATFWKRLSAGFVRLLPIEREL